MYNKVLCRLGWQANISVFEKEGADQNPNLERDENYAIKENLVKLKMYAHRHPNFARKKKSSKENSTVGKFPLKLIFPQRKETIKFSSAISTIIISP